MGMPAGVRARRELHCLGDDLGRVEHGDWHKRHAEMRAKYDQLSAADKAKFDDLTKQLKQLHHERMQLLGISKS